MDSLSKKGLLLLVPFVVFMAYLSLSLYVLWTGHPHEDAYILYVFSENFAAGNGIAYFDGGPPAEGATDFLWMLLLGVSQYLGLDVAVAAGVWNGVGLAASLFFVQLLYWNQASGFLRIFISCLFGLLLLGSQVAGASIGGFGPGFYTAFVMALVWLLYSGDTKYLWFLPCVGLILGLIRPDGVILGIVGSLAGLWLVWETLERKKFLAVSCVCTIAGIGYFAWRYTYFDALLPLPLYVKSANALTMPGLLQNKYWLLENKFIVALAVFGFFASQHRQRFFLAVLPSLILLLALTFATQSQNISYRLQAPVTITMIFLSGLFVSELLKNQEKGANTIRWGLFYLFMTLAFYSNGKDLKQELHYLQNDDYINFLPYHLRTSFDSEHRIALTEAGRFAYWVAGEKYDLVGLNTREPALGLLDTAYIQLLDPDIIFMHLASSVRFDELCDSSAQYCRITRSQLIASMNANTLVSNVASGAVSLAAVQKAPLVVLEAMSKEMTGYEFFLVRYSGSTNSDFGHFYALKKSSQLLEGFIFGLEKSFLPAARLSYLEMKASFSPKKYSPSEK